MSHTIFSKQFRVVVVAILLSSFLPAKAQVSTISAKPLVIGETRIIKSAILDEDRTINIYQPQGFSSDSTYPVIYVLDGGTDEDFLHITGLVQFFNLMYNMPPCLVVGIVNVDRKRDLTFPTTVKKDKENYPTTGGSARFISFIEKELQPYIGTAYKTSGTRYLIGQSLGGLLATEILLQRPSLFTHYLIISPSLWWDKESLLKKGPGLLAGQRDINAYVYISVGAEGDIMEKDARQLAAIIKQSGIPGIKLDFLPLADENHATILHHSLYEAFRLLFPYKQ